MRAAVLVLCLIAGTAAAQEQAVEQVTVYGGTLSGIWKVTSPDWLQVTLFHGAHWGPLRENYCRIDRDASGYVTHCFGLGAASADGGLLETDGTHFHLAWGTMMARIVLDGAVESATRFSGHYAAKLAGISMENPTLSVGEKIAGDPTAADAGGQTGVVRAILEGTVPPHDAKLNDRIDAARSANLGPIQAVTYIGQQAKRGGPTQPAIPEYLGVYAVAYQQGERLCALHDKADGKLTFFQCV